MRALVYTKEQCPYCDKAKTLLKIKKIDYIETKIGADMTREDFLATFPDQRTVPLIFIDDEKIGGYDDIVKWFDGRK